VRKYDKNIIKHHLSKIRFARGNIESYSNRLSMSDPAKLIRDHRSSIRGSRMLQSIWYIYWRIPRGPKQSYTRSFHRSMPIYTQRYPLHGRVISAVSILTREWRISTRRQDRVRPMGQKHRTSIFASCTAYSTSPCQSFVIEAGCLQIPT